MKKVLKGVAPITNKKNGYSLYDSVIAKDNEIDVSESLVKYIPKVYFNEIGGLENVLSKIREVIELPIKRPEIFKRLMIQPHKGIILYGPPGCGKTMIAKAIATELNAHFISAKGPEILSKWYGDSEEKLRQIFDEAAKLNPSIILFDEIDSIGAHRDSDVTARHDSKIVNQLLTLMDGIEEYSNVKVIATTNRLDILDEALLRPGRFDYKILIERPTDQGCREIFKILIKGIPISKSVNIETIVTKLYGMSGAEIAYVVRESAYNTIRRSIDVLKVIESENEIELDLDELELEELDFINAIESISKS